MVLKNAVYDKLKWVTQILLPACGTLYFALSSIWGLPYGEEVIGTLSAIAIFLGASLSISSKKYEPTTDGTLVVSESGDLYAKLHNDPATLANQKQVTMAIKTS